MKNKKTEGLAFRFLYPHAESNRNRQNRNLKFYPLNYRGGYFAKLIIFVRFHHKYGYYSAMWRKQRAA